ncbi:MAG: hypothetical protein DCC55_31060, partial [Chloroflexi bacterium]
MASNHVYSFTTADPPPVPPDDGPGGPILVISAAANPFSRYYTEILRAEGLNLFLATDISKVSAATLDAYDVVILGEMPLTSAQVTMFTNWVTAGGNLIAMRPDKQLAGLLGLTTTPATLAEGYLLVDTTTQPGFGIVGETIQFHGTADLYNLAGANRVATLYTNATTPAAGNAPAATLRTVGSNGGQAAAFTYDLARSIVYTRQGNPAWAGQNRDGLVPNRSNDMFYGNLEGAPEPDWVNLDKVAIPQADEQQRLLANLILYMNADRKPLPRFWYFPKNHKAVVIMTGDDHGVGLTKLHFDTFQQLSPPNCSVADWECIRGTSYVYTVSPFTAEEAFTYNAAGFEVALHVNTGCADYTASSLAADFSSQLAGFQAKYSTLPAPVTNRTHCIAWSDWATQALVSAQHGIRLDTNYYYFPGSWVNGRDGFFTGSGMIMRFADLDGTLIDVYQATTQMTDESNQNYPATADVLLDRALGPEGYYGAFTANMHTDRDTDNPVAIIQSAQARGVPVITARQMLTWVDGRNSSAFSSLNWNGNTLTFSINAGTGARNLRAMLPAQTSAGAITSINYNGAPISFSTEVIKGVTYVIFPAQNGLYQASTTPIPPDTEAPTVAISSPANGAVVTGTVAVAATASDNVAVAGVQFRLNGANLGAEDTVAPYAVSWDSTTVANGTYQLTAVARDAAGNTTTSSPVDVTVDNVPDTTPPTVTSVTPPAGSVNVAAGANITVIFDEPMDAATINATTIQLRDAANTVVPASVSYNAANRTATLDPTDLLLSSTTYTALVRGGSTDPRVKDVAGNALANDFTWSFTTAAPSPFVSIWDETAVPTLASKDDSNAIEVGVKFQSDIAGYVSGIRFYKGAANIGTHIGNLWSSSGQLLASATFVNETASGWQQVFFATPVLIEANTTYVASYHAAVGRYAYDENYFATNGVNSPPLRALSTGAASGNGVFRYGATSGFPTESFNASNYWVDVLFSTSIVEDTTAPTVVGVGPVAGASGVAVSTVVTATFSEALDPASINGTTFELRDGQGAVVAASVSYAAGALTASLTPASALA